MSTLLEAIENAILEARQTGHSQAETVHAFVDEYLRSKFGAAIQSADASGERLIQELWHSVMGTQGDVKE